MPRVTYIDALHRTLIELMQADPSVIAIGGLEEPVAGPSVGAVMGRERVIAPPVSEMGYCGTAIGAAVAGMRPIVTFNTASFMVNALEQVLNEASLHHYLSGGQVSLPMVIYCAIGAHGVEGAQHGLAPQAILWNTPGLKLVLPSTPADIQGLLRTAVADPNPVVIMDQRRLHRLEGEIGEDGAAIPFGVAAVRREGRDVTIVATSLMAQHALAAAERLQEEGIGAEIIDPRTLVPFDDDTLVASVRKTGRLVVVDESHLSCGAGAEIAARIGHAAFRDLKAPIERVATLDVPIPFSPVLEEAVIPTPARIADAARRTVNFS
jgi:pyruvate dehydrogenase E1 component beta subunit